VPVVNAMITFSGDFCLFYVKKWEFFLKANVIIKIFELKTPIFAIFGEENILDIIASVPGLKKV
jgi:hypothetical protein